MVSRNGLIGTQNGIQMNFQDKLFIKIIGFKAKFLIYWKIGGRDARKLIKSDGNFTLISPWNVLINGDLYINQGCYINAMGGVEFGSNVVLSAGVKIVSSGLPLNSKQRVNINHVNKKIKIGENVWFGVDSVVLGGVSIGDNSVVAAGSIVINSVPPNVVVAGAPAKIIKIIDAL